MTQVPLDFQNRVLSYGILGAVVMRAIFIALGEAAMNAFHPVLLGFAGILLFSSYKLLSEGEGGDDEDLTDNKVVNFASNTLDATDAYDGDKFFTLVRIFRHDVCDVHCLPLIADLVAQTYALPRICTSCVGQKQRLVWYHRWYI